MIKTRVIALAFVMFPYHASAAEQSATLGAFLKSVTSLYVASEECKHVAYLHSESYSGIIKDYLTHFYGDAIPYWALPVVNNHAVDRQQCIDTISEGLVIYSAFSTQFASNYPDQPLPPSLPELYTTQTYTPQYRMTAPVITK